MIRKLNSKDKFWQKGFSTLEILLAMAILVITLSGAAVVISESGGGVGLSLAGTRMLALDSRLNMEALSLARTNLSMVQDMAYRDFFNIDDVSTNDDIYTETVTSDWSPLYDYAKWIKSKVSWNVGGRLAQVELETLVANPESAVRGDTCNPDVDKDDWSNPKLLGSFDFTSNSGATDIDVKARKIYLTTAPAADSKEDFYVIDVQDGLEPKKIAAINTGYGLAGVAVFGNYAYVANLSSATQLQVINIANPAAPEVVAQLELKNMQTGDDCKGKGNSIYYHNGFVYLGLTKDENCPEFNIIDVNDPESPSQAGGWEAGTQVNDTKVRDGLAYLAVPYSTEDDIVQPVKGNLIILDIKDLDDIDAVNSFAAKSAIDDIVTDKQIGRSLALDGDRLYLGRGFKLADDEDEHELMMLDISDPYALKAEESVNIGDSADAIITRGGLLFVMTGDPNLGFQIWNAGSAALAGSLNVQQASTGGMDCEDDILYIAQRSNGALQIIGPESAGLEEYSLSNSGDISVEQGGIARIMITVSKIYGWPQPSFNVSGLPDGASASFSKDSCAADCVTELTITTHPTESPAGDYPIIVTGSGGVTTKFNLKLNPGFGYNISQNHNNNSNPLVLVKGGGSVEVVATVEMNAGAIPQPVTLTAPNPDNLNILVAPGNVATCTPAAEEPYICTATFYYSAKSKAAVGQYPGQAITGLPNSVSSPDFKIKVVNH